MSWNGTYSHTLAIAIDILTASIFWNKQDLTVSSLCGVALRNGRTKSLLGLLGRALNRLQPGHCELAIQADWNRASQTMVFLTTLPAPVNNAPHAIS